MGWVVRFSIYDTSSEEGGIDIPLYHARFITEHMPPLTERLPLAKSGGVIVLRHSQRPSVQINQLAASTFSLATQLFDNHPGYSKFYVLAIIHLQGLIRQCFRLDDLAQPENLVGPLACVSLHSAASLRSVSR
jgi:hypothetical protein